MPYIFVLELVYSQQASKSFNIEYNLKDKYSIGK